MKKILVIEDEPEMRRNLATILKLEKFSVTQAENGRVGIDLAKKETPDLILCDVMMPEKTGMDVYAELMRSAPDQAERMVFMTGGAFTPRAREFLDRVPNLRVEKPFGAEQLRALVNDRIR